MAAVSQASDAVQGEVKEDEVKEDDAKEDDAKEDGKVKEDAGEGEGSETNPESSEVAVAK